MLQGINDAVIQDINCAGEFQVSSKFQSCPQTRQLARRLRSSLPIPKPTHIAIPDISRPLLPLREPRCACATTLGVTGAA